MRRGQAPDDQSEESKEKDKERNLSGRKRPMDMIKWTVAFDHMAMVMHAVEASAILQNPSSLTPFVASQVWDYTAAMAHKQCCLQIASRANLSGCKYHLARFYDEVAALMR